jgi:hypothetical protein
MTTIGSESTVLLSIKRRFIVLTAAVEGSAATGMIWRNIAADRQLSKLA